MKRRRFSLRDCRWFAQPRRAKEPDKYIRAVPFPDLCSCRRNRKYILFPFWVGFLYEAVLINHSHRDKPARDMALMNKRFRLDGVALVVASPPRIEGHTLGGLAALQALDNFIGHVDFL